jgi:hypothetical protein
MADALSRGPFIYSRKPSPNFIGVGTRLDESAFSRHIEKTIRTAGNCRLEIIFRDVYALNGDKTKPARAVKITRELIDRYWK